MRSIQGPYKVHTRSFLDPLSMAMAGLWLAEILLWPSVLTMDMTGHDPLVALPPGQLGAAHKLQR